jgi:hypothetical protein
MSSGVSGSESASVRRRAVLNRAARSVDRQHSPISLTAHPPASETVYPEAAPFTSICMTGWKLINLPSAGRLFGGLMLDILILVSDLIG